MNDTRIVLEAKITNSFVKILDTLWDQVPKYLEKLGTNYFVIIAYPENIRQITVDPEESKKSLEMAINAWKTRNEMAPKTGKGKYVLAEYEKIKRITLPLGGDHMLYITTEPQADHVKILDRISKISLD